MAVLGRIPVSFGEVFPHGVFATAAAEPLENFETKRQETDKENGLPVWVVDVYDADPEANHKNSAIKVKISAQVCPVVPEAVFGPFRPCEFDGLTVTPYVDDSGKRPRIAYSFRARGVRAPAGAAGGTAKTRPATQAKDAA
ncbi:plasmid replication, integration and excision activator [Actinomadura harenae]|uniref:Plasmid replication, integration and excision activator n=1 Tax=Actinomadura harenae TaxID=2483351 RepID=A0A3M2LNE8_9ACTN|nr:plasmid replication, integration and excision activator [Actinomadura harenae]RMI38063.1 plasmid replication, integration and excision activator [Actinomadura harenae]